MPSDIELLRRYVFGRSQEAFGELVGRHVDLVYSAALRRVGMDAHLAEDVTQEVFAELARKSGTLLDRPALEGWLYTTSRFKAIDAVRSASRRRMREALLMNANQMADAAEPEWEKLRPLIDDALDSLGKADAEVLILRFFRNLSPADVARTLSMSEDAARMRVSRAMERLRTALAKRGIKSTTEALALVLANRAVAGAPYGLAARVVESALAVGKASASATGAALHAANTVKLVSGFATLALLLASVATAVYEARAHHEADEHLARAEEENAATTARIHSVTLEVASVRESEEGLKSEVGMTLAEVDLAKARRAGASDKAAVGRDFIAHNPNAPGLIAGHDMAHNAQKYAALFGSLGLSSEKQTRFLSLLAERSDLGLTWFAAPDTGTPSASIAAGTDSLSPDEVSDQLRNLLGDEGFKAYQDYVRVGAAQELGQRLAGSLYATDSPISQAQGVQIVQILAQSSSDYQNGKGMWSPSQVDWSSALSNAQAVLSDPQMNALRALKLTTEFEQAINAATNQAAGQAVDKAVASLAAAGKDTK